MGLASMGHQLQRPLVCRTEYQRLEFEMTKEQILETIKLLSALESWSFAKDRGTIPDYLLEDLNNAVDMLTKEILEGK